MTYLACMKVFTRGLVTVTAVTAANDDTNHTKYRTECFHGAIVCRLIKRRVYICLIGIITMEVYPAIIYRFYIPYSISSNHISSSSGLF
jgi:hypothetical protein